jgi:hypothetical protein
MDYFQSGGIFSAASIVTAFLWSKTALTASHAVFLALVLFVVGTVGVKISRALISPYISPL